MATKYTATVYNAAGGKQETKNLKSSLHKFAKSEAFDLLPEADGSQVEVERNGLYMGRYERIATKAVWTLE